MGILYARLDLLECVIFTLAMSYLNWVGVFVDRFTCGHVTKNNRFPKF